VTVEPVYPGAWRLWVRVDGYAAGFADVVVAAGPGEVLARVELGSVGRLRGRVTLAGGGAPPERTSLSARLTGNLSLPGGQGWDRTGRSSASAAASADGAFELEDLVPGKWRVDAQAPGWLGSAEVRVGSVREAWVEIVLHPASLLRFRGESPVPEQGWVMLSLRTAGGEWREVGGRAVQAGEHFEYPTTVEPGAVEWRLEFRSARSTPTQRVEMAAAQTGSLVATLDGPREIGVPVD
jgi:hypothetical protein